MPAGFAEVRRRLGGLAAVLRRGVEMHGKENDSFIRQDVDVAPQQASHSGNSTKDRSRLPMLEYVPGTWMEEESLADISSTVTQTQTPDIAPTASSFLHAEGDPWYKYRDRSEMRLNNNFAVHRISSMPAMRSEDSLYYNESGNIGVRENNRKHHNLEHPYCCPNQRDIEKGRRNLFPFEDIDPDWRVQALKESKAGQWCTEDFSEQHLAERLFYNAQIIAPRDHLAGSRKAAVQDLRAMCIEHGALQVCAAQATSEAISLEKQAKTGKKKLHHLDGEIEALRTLWGSHHNGEGVLSEQ